MRRNCMTIAPVFLFKVSYFYFVYKKKVGLFDTDNRFF